MPKNPEPEALYQRATDSAKETRHTVIAIASTSLAVFFHALTMKVEPPLTATQRWVVLSALIVMASAVFTGLWAAWSEARWSHAWGRELEEGAEDTEAWRSRKDFWHQHKRWGETLSLVSFATAVLLAGVYSALRAFHF